MNVCLNLNIIVIRGYSLFLTFFRPYKAYCGARVRYAFQKCPSKLPHNHSWCQAASYKTKKFFR